jgi:hypothetical protein
MIPKSGYRFPACAKPRLAAVRVVKCFGGREGRSEKIMLKQKAKAKYRLNLSSISL